MTRPAKITQDDRMDKEELLLQMKALSHLSPTLGGLFRKNDIQEARLTEVASAEEMMELMSLFADVNLLQESQKASVDNRPQLRRTRSLVRSPLSASGGRVSPIPGASLELSSRNSTRPAAGVHYFSCEKIPSDTEVPADHPMLTKVHSWPGVQSQSICHHTVLPRVDIWPNVETKSTIELLSGLLDSRTAPKRQCPPTSKSCTNVYDNMQWEGTSSSVGGSLRGFRGLET